MTAPPRPATVGDLRASGYHPVSVRAEMRRNLIRKLENHETIFPGIVGYEDTVIPQVINAILAGQDIVFLGERGQAKSRLIRSLTSLLDDEIPILAGCEIPENPFGPISQQGRDLIATLGDNAPITWLHRDQRYGEKLATPDISIADLIGEVDPIKIAEGRYLSDELTIHYGLIPRSNRGIFCINELPDLAERIQVGLLNIMEERDVQIRGFRVRLDLDILIVASANPEDYTNRGRIITPLKDRYGAQIRTHYPRTAAAEIEIVEQERAVFQDGDYQVTIPAYMKEIVAEVTALARRSPDVNQRSGVSVRMSIANMETLVANALRRAISLGEHQVTPRISDLPALLPSTAGKIELETMDEGREDRLLDKFLAGAVLTTFNRYFKVTDFADFIEDFNGGSMVIEVGDQISSREYVRHAREVHGLADGLRRLEAGENPAEIAAAMEFILEGLHLNKKLNKARSGGRALFRGFADAS